MEQLYLTAWCPFFFSVSIEKPSHKCFFLAPQTRVWKYMLDASLQARSGRPKGGELSYRLSVRYIRCISLQLSLPSDPWTKVQQFALHLNCVALNIQYITVKVGSARWVYHPVNTAALCSAYWRFSVFSCLVVYTLLGVRSDPSSAYCCIIFPSPRPGRINVLSHDGRHCASMWEIQPRPRLPSSCSAKKKNLPGNCWICLKK